ncbi:MAG: benzoate-CoA ligase family protein [Acidobacteria bacterium]|nr:benzoate-CoA ligase family protein [Acidobacteriota bacterium]
MAGSSGKSASGRRGGDTWESAWRNKDVRAVRSPEDLPETFNFAAALLDRHLAEGRGARIALRGPAGEYTYAELTRLVNQTANALKWLGLQREQRVIILLRDSPEFIATYLGAMKMGAVPVSLNTFAHPSEYEFYLSNSRARIVVGEAEFLAPIADTLKKANLLAVVTVRDNTSVGEIDFKELVSAQSTELDPAPTHRDDPSHWVYTSGSTGNPKGAVHLHKNTMFAIDPFCRHVLQMTPDDITFSVSRLFFSYGLANSMFIPLWTGGSVVLMPMRPEPERIFEFIELYKPTIFFCVPTGYNRLLRENMDPAKLKSLRLCVSAGEALPSPIYSEWKAQTALETIDGVGSTEFGYIYLCNRPGDIHLDSSGKIFPEHNFRLVNAAGAEAGQDELGELWVSSPAVASYYWRNHEGSKRAFNGEWLLTGDQYQRDKDGYLSYHGRSDDLFKAGGIWISPIQVETALLSHPAVSEAAVVAEKDAQGLEKPAAFVVLKPSNEANPQTEAALIHYTREILAHYKCPRHIHFVNDLPKTATGKIQRYKLRASLNA